MVVLAVKIPEKTSATGIWSNSLSSIRTQHGFTLVELVVVMVIFAIIVTMATISIGDPQAKRIKHSSNQVASLIQLAKEQAIFNSQDYALSIWESGYGFYLLDESGWVPVTGDRIFRSRELPTGLEFNLYLDDLKVILTQTDKEKPQVFITSDGEISPFRLEITDRRDWVYQIEFDEIGDFIIDVVNA